LKALITERGDPTSRTEVEFFWMAPDKWRRTIRSETEFSQTLVMNGSSIFEWDSGDYFPLWSQTLAAAMVDPSSVLNAYWPGDVLLGRASGGGDAHGMMRFPVDSMTYGRGLFSSGRTAGSVGRRVDLTNYQDFHDKSIARHLFYAVDPGDNYQAEVTELSDLKKPPRWLFAIPTATPWKDHIRSLILPETELRSRANQPLEIVWPQVLDGRLSGLTGYYISVDRSGQVREVLPLSVSVERGDDSARRQMMQWKFQPFLQDGVPLQTEGVLNFRFDTRAYGPAEPLTDEETRKLAANIVEPQVPPGTSSGATCTIRVAVDINGDVIEAITGPCAPPLSRPSSDALRQWRFRPIVQYGKPLPYRGEVVFRSP
jgi:hypothetical protein